MLRSLMLSCVLLAAVPGLALAQDDLPIDECVEKWREAVKKKITADQIHFVEHLGGRWASATDAQKKSIQELAGKNLRVENADVREKTVATLGILVGGPKNKFSDISAALLTAEIAKKSTEDDLPYFGTVLVALGRTQSEKAGPVLLKHLRYKDAPVIASAAEAMAQFRDAKHEVRKAFVEEILKTYSAISNQMKSDPRNTTAKTKFETVTGSMESSLKALTGQQVVGAEAWWTWWNDTGKKATDW